MGPTAVYRPRRPESSSLYRLLQEHYERLVRVHEERFRHLYGPLHKGVAEVVRKFLDCGILENGFTRVHCPECRSEFLVAFSCKCRYFCPSCHTKRLLLWSDWLEEELLDHVPHRQYVFTVPKRLRPYFLYDRRLLGRLSRIAYDTLRSFLAATIGESQVVPGVVSSIQSFGTLLNWQPHIHMLATDGAYREDRSFVPLSFHYLETLAEAFRRAVLAEFVRRGLFTPEIADSMLAWPHSGFHVHNGVRIEADDDRGRLQLARYAARAPLSLNRMTYDLDEGTVTIASDKTQGPTAGIHRFDALEFLARLLAHVPRKGEILVRYCGAYSVRRRAAWRERGILGPRPAHDGNAEPGTSEPEEPLPTPERIRAMRTRWAQLLRRIWDVDILACPKCGGAMVVLDFTLDPSAIASTLRSLRNKGNDPRAGPWAARAPP